MGERYYNTTPIYYVNSVPHIGTALTTFAADVDKRYRTLRGLDPFFLTGTDENGLKVLEAAQKASRDPHEFVAEIAGEFEKIWANMNIRPDRFIRTTEEAHFKTAQRFFDTLRDRGHIYQDRYEGWYDVSTETFYKESDLVDGKSPDGNEVAWVEEENWFFRLSAFQDRILGHIDANPGFILPESRKNEVVSFIRQGLRDTCISRINPGWGVPVPDDEDRVMYVWFDALINYVTATVWPAEGWQELWPADAQWMGKDILTRFHATLWPAMLMGMELPLPKVLIGHGFMLVGGEKISKSRGNSVAPFELAKALAQESGCDLELGVDAVRHYMGASMPYETDSTFTPEDLKRRYNSDLANDLGNALNRTLAMAHKFVGGKVPDADIEPAALRAIEAARLGYEKAMDAYRIDRAVESAMTLVRWLNKYIDERAPWTLAKAGSPELGGVMRSMLACLRAAEVLFRPTLPTTADRIAEQLGAKPLTNWSKLGDPESLPSGTLLAQPEPLFPRIEMEKTETTPEPAPPKQKRGLPEPADRIEFDELLRIDLRVARVIEAEPIEGSDKLLRLQVQIGDEQRQIVAGIAKQYEPLDLIGRQVIVVANLASAKLMGVESQGMILAADGPDGGAILLQPDRDAPEASRVH